MESNETKQNNGKLGEFKVREKAPISKLGVKTYF